MLRTLIAGLGITLALGCGASLPQDITPALVKCKLRALDSLPADPKAINSHDLDTLAGKLQACHAPADAGAP